jgi:wyosine [tRNA(Phe)-imidazoG37] synthetase (radical SAM superfamily)
MKATHEQPVTPAGADATSTPTAPSAPVHRRTPGTPEETAFGCARDFLDNRYVYAVISPRARGLSIGVNLNPDKRCNFKCVYCEVDRTKPGGDAKLDLDVMAEELHRMLNYVYAGGLAMHPRYAGLSPELLKPRHVTLSGDGEPTLAPQFLEIVQTVAHVRAMARVPFFKIVLITNASHLDSQQVQAGLRLFTSHDEVWAKLEAGTPGFFARINEPDVQLEKILSNILLVGRQRPVVIQSLFPMLNDQPPTAEEIEAYAQRLNELKQGGAKISLVQIYSATRPHNNPNCEHMPLRYLSNIAQTVRLVTGLKTEVY